MTTQTLIAGLIFVVAQICIITASTVVYGMIAMINDRAAPHEKVTFLFGNMGKWGIPKKYKEIYPGGPLYKKYYMYLVTGFFLMFLSVLVWLI